jgi:uncharacterized membrane protein
MEKERLTAFSDGVIAIIITIMVLELKVPQATDMAALTALFPTFLSYALSFIYVGIYWNNHHHMLHLVKQVNGPILWANTHLLFWLSLMPFATAWMGENYLATIPTAIYGVALLMPAIAYYILQKTIIRSQGKASPLAKAIGRDRKGKASPVLYLSGVGLAFIHPWLADIIYIAVACMWFIPDRRIEKTIHHA